MSIDRRPYNRIEQASKRADHELRQAEKTHPIDKVWKCGVEGHRAVRNETTSVHDDLYDERGLP
ncbi:hypothetical protein AC244_34120 [Ensifer adhaerens]|uniref:Uncharacterized protein n=1 Tax=Ensifer adhaerens TaxID=106592 RepID=A0A0L8BD13_ENSAD|nr:hypothetical protein AC244_34120 [Ensifer adhaerens]